MLEGFTGYLLPWDQTAYWASVVGINLNGTAPFLGPFLALVPPGRRRDRGEHAHASSTPCTCCSYPARSSALIVLHLYLVVRLGVSSPPWSDEAAGRERPAVVGNGRAGLVSPAPRGGKAK